MNYCRGTLKGYFVLGGIALMLATCLQQTHALCGLVGCSTTEVYKSLGNSSGCGGCCSGRAKLPSRTPAQKTNPNLPCGPDCLCTQVSDPPEAPRVTSEITKSQVTALGAEIVAGDDARFAPSGPADLLLFEDLVSVSASDTCVRLCRFLT